MSNLGSCSNCELPIYGDWIEPMRDIVICSRCARGDGYGARMSIRNVSARANWATQQEMQAVNRERRLRGMARMTGAEYMTAWKLIRRAVVDELARNGVMPDVKVVAR